MPVPLSEMQRSPPGIAQDGAARATVTPPLVIAATTLGGALLLLWPAFLNGFPIVYSDTGTYVWSGFTGRVPFDRPVTYGLFLRASSLGISPWLTVFSQGLLISWLLGVLFRRVARLERAALATLAALAIVALTTGVGLYVSLLIPDVFAPIAILAVTVLALAPTLRRFECVIASGAMILASVVHFSHLLVSILMLMALAAYRLLARTLPERPPRPQRLGLIAALAGSSWLLLPATHAALGAGFVVTRGAPVFATGRMAENGILSDYLHDECTTHVWRICEFKDRIPRNIDLFVWDDRGPFQMTGGASPENLREYGEIVRGTFCSRRWITRQAAEALIGTGRQLGRFAVWGWLIPYVEATAPYAAIREWFPHHLQSYLAARQQRGALNLGWLDRVQPWVLLASAVVVAARLAAARRLRLDRAFGLALLLTLAVFANAAIFGSLSGQFDRYQGRVVWLMPLAAVLVFARVLAFAERGSARPRQPPVS